MLAAAVLHPLGRLVLSLMAEVCPAGPAGSVSKRALFNLPVLEHIRFGLFFFDAGFRFGFPCTPIFFFALSCRILNGLKAFSGLLSQ